MPRTKKTAAAKSKSKKPAKATKTPVAARPKRFAVRTRIKTRRQKARQARSDFPKLSSGYRLVRDSLSLVRQHWKLFGGITLIYFVLTVVLVGINSSNFSELRSNFTGQLGQAATSALLLGVLLGSGGGTGSTEGSVFQSLITIIISLATIWALRQVMAGEKIKVRDTFYKGMYPIIPFLLTLLILSAQLIPAVLGAGMLAVVGTGVMFVEVWEQVPVIMLIVLLFATSVYLVIPGFFALYIVTLPDMRPVTAFKTALRMVRYRRWAIIRKLLFLVLCMLIVLSIVFLPLITVLPGIVVWVYALFSMFGLVFIHIYVYSLYRELL